MNNPFDPTRATSVGIDRQKHPSYLEMVSMLVAKMHHPENHDIDGATRENLEIISHSEFGFEPSLPPQEVQDQRCSIFLNQTGNIQELNERARTKFSIAAGENLQDLMVTPQKFETGTADEVAKLVFLIDRNEQPIIMVGVKEPSTQNWLLLEPEHKWPHGFSQRLTKLYGLTGRECIILEQICAGATSKDIAIGEQRKVGTIRQQIKSILGKLEINSQAQAVALVTSILVTIAGLNPPNQSQISGKRRASILGVNGTIGLDRFGLLRGEPVILFHGALFGICSHAPDQSIAQTIGLNVIAPHRPGYGKTPFSKQRDDAVDLSIENTLRVMNHEKIDRAVLLAHDIGTAYAFAFAAQHPSRVAGIVCGPTTPPMHNWQQTSQMPVRHRVNAWAAQKLPQVMDTIVSLGLAHIGKNGHDVIPEYVFADSEFDRTTWQQPQFVNSIIDSFGLVQQQGGAGFKFDMHLTNNDWSALAATIDCPVTLVHGGLNQTVSLDAVLGFGSKMINATVKTIADAGHTIALTHSAEIYREVSRLSILAHRG